MYCEKHYRIPKQNDGLLIVGFAKRFSRIADARNEGSAVHPKEKRPRFADELGKNNEQSVVRGLYPAYGSVFQCISIYRYRGTRRYKRDAEKNRQRTQLEQRHRVEEREKRRNGTAAVEMLTACLVIPCQIRDENI